MSVGRVTDHPTLLTARSTMLTKGECSGQTLSPAYPNMMGNSSTDHITPRQRLLYIPWSDLPGTIETLEKYKLHQEM